MAGSPVQYLHHSRLTKSTRRRDSVLRALTAQLWNVNIRDSFVATALLVVLGFCAWGAGTLVDMQKEVDAHARTKMELQLREYDARNSLLSRVVNDLPGSLQLLQLYQGKALWTQAHQLVVDKSTLRTWDASTFAETVRDQQRLLEQLSARPKAHALCLEVQARFAGGDNDRLTTIPKSLARLVMEANEISVQGSAEENTLALRGQLAAVSAIAGESHCQSLEGFAKAWATVKPQMESLLTMGRDELGASTAEDERFRRSYFFLMHVLRLADPLATALIDEMSASIRTSKVRHQLDMNGKKESP